ncbi:MAG: ribonuclease P protein component [Bacteroides sp.]|nr:ribonuclease P protein component [Bacteroides sp.]
MDQSGSFDRRYRLLKPEDFRYVFEKACKVSDRYLTLLARPNNIGYPRLGMAIAKKQIKTAVGRNRVKRQIRESFRLHKEIIGGLDIVILARSGSDRCDPRKLQASLDNRWRELVKRCASS